MQKRPRNFSPGPLRELRELIAVLAAEESPLPFSFRALVGPASAEPQLPLRLLAGPQVAHTNLVLALFHPAVRPDLRRQVALLEVDVRQVVRALLRLSLRHQERCSRAACQVDEGRAGLAPLRRDAHAHLDRLEVVSRRAQFQKFYRDLALECLLDHQPDRADFHHLAVEEAYASVEAMAAPRREVFVRCLEKLPHLELCLA
jgi:hypothetical protein